MAKLDDEEAPLRGCPYCLGSAAQSLANAASGAKWTLDPASQMFAHGRTSRHAPVVAWQKVAHPSGSAVTIYKLA